MRSAIWIDVFNADHLLTGGTWRARGECFELEQPVDDQAERGRELIEGRAAGRLADGVDEGDGGVEQQLAKALILVGE